MPRWSAPGHIELGFYGFALPLGFTIQRPLPMSLAKMTLLDRIATPQTSAKGKVLADASGTNCPTMSRSLLSLAEVADVDGDDAVRIPRAVGSVPGDLGVVDRPVTRRRRQGTDVRRASNAATCFPVFALNTRR